MCGILGFIANRTNGFNQPEIKAVQDALYVTALRGMDSTGVFYVTNSGDVQAHKETGESAKFLKTKEWEATSKELYKNGQAVVGHCRASTRGAKTDANAHPFIVDNKIVLVHNGTVTGSHDHLAKTDVDSHAIAHVLAEEDNIATALSRINGAYALIWYNTETGKLHAIRNKERPLWFGLLEDGSMIFTSEMSFMYMACWRNGLKIQENWPQQLPEHQLFTCDLSDIKSNYEWEDLDCGYKPPVKEVFRRPETPVSKNVMALAAPRVAGHIRSERGQLPSLAEVAEELGIGAFNEVDQWRDRARVNQNVVCEATEYKHIHNDVYYVYGQIACVNTKLNDFPCCWEITAVNEESVVELVSKQFFEGKIEYGVGRGIILNKGDTMTALFKLYDVKLLDTAPVSLMELQ